MEDQQRPGVISQQATAADNRRQGRVLIIADDLTGACDAAAPFACHGRRTIVTCQPEPPEAQPSNALSVCTRSRAIEPSDAAERVTRVCKSWCLVDGDRFIKKIDSTLKGNIASEVDAMLKATPAEAAIVAPAFPEQGRTLRGGVLHVAETPVAELDLPKILEQTSFSVKRIPRGHINDFSMVQGSLKAQKSIFVFDSHDAEDLDNIADTVSRLGPRTLIVGTSGITRRLAAKWSLGDDNQTVEPMAADRFIVVSGSRQQVTTKQIQHLVQTRNGAHFTIQSARDIESVVVGNTPTAIELPWDVGNHRQLDNLPSRLSTFGPAVLVLTGGDTAQWLFDTSGAESVTICGEVEIAIPIGKIRGGKLDGFPVVTKAGGFGKVNTLTGIYDQLCQGHDGRD